MSSRNIHNNQNLEERFARFNVADDDDDEDDEEDEDYQPGEDENELQFLSDAVQLRVEKLKDLDSQRSTLIEEYISERAALELKFAKLYSPLYDQRREIITGVHDEAIASEAPEDKETAEDEKIQDDTKGVEDFWVTAMSNMDPITELITEDDFKCLSSLEDIRCLDFEDGKGFTLEFHFQENEYFTNKVLTKKYFIPNLFLEDEPILKKVEGCEINWKDGKCLTHTEVTKKQRSKSGKKAGQVRTVTTKESTDSFFHFFSPPKFPENDDVDEDEVAAIGEAFDRDYDVAQSLRAHVIPKAVRWFTGEALDDDDDDEADKDGGDEGENVITDRPTLLPPSDVFGQTPTAGENPPECKQN